MTQTVMPFSPQFTQSLAGVYHREALVPFSRNVVVTSLYRHRQEERALGDSTVIPVLHFNLGPC
jgi:hypothetical protein